MKIPYNWLKDYVDIGLKPRLLAEKLTIAGLEVVAIEKQDNDWVMEIEITPNRPDCLGLVGIAREVAAITGKNLRLPKVSLPPAKEIKGEDLSVEIKDKLACAKYTGRIISGIKVGPSPAWLKGRLLAVGVRPVNNVVDITNYCLFEWGQPLHAFDYDKLKGGKIIVRPAKPEETIVTIDNVRRKLDKSMLVIADTDKAVAVAGVIGGKDTEVREETKNILLESAYFAPLNIRRTARELGMGTESSYRFERGVDLEGVLAASDRASALVLELAGGRLQGKVKQAGKRSRQSREIILRPLKVNQVLGVFIPILGIKAMLKRLQFGIRSQDKHKLRVTIPSFREDITREIDLIEEIARLYGYDRIPLSMPRVSLGSSIVKARQTGRKAEALTREALTAIGFNEIITYSLISRSLLAKSNLDREEVTVIENPLSYDQEIMRPSLIPGLLTVVAHNINRKVPDISIFELGRVYLKRGRKPVEKMHLSLAISGEREGGRRHKDKRRDFFDLKGAVEVLLDKLGVTGYKVAAEGHPGLSPEESACIIAGKKRIGFLGAANAAIVKAFDLPKQVYIAELFFEQFAASLNPEKYFQQLPRYPSVTRDIAIVIKDEISSAAIVSLLTEAGEGLITNIRLFDEYSGKQIPPGRKGLAYSLEYRRRDRTLTDEEVNRIHSRVCENLTRELGAEIR